MNSNYFIHLEWVPNDFLGPELFDLDLTVFLLNKEGKVAKEEDFIFYNHLSNENESVKHSGDNIEEQDGTMKEEVVIQLDELPEEVVRIAFAVAIHVHVKNLNFGQISEARLQVVHTPTEKPLITYDLTEDFSLDTAILMGEFEREAEGWKFKSLVQSFHSLKEISEGFGLKVM
ncbi:TerD family protein [Tepidibacillus marianensis]|uniref:TerD family protein n=1 Tax=Tepidibacillus marianensis TaxID=3131995 RepID=UPI0030CABE69